MIGNPIKNFINTYYPKGSVTQYFGENPALYMKNCDLAGHNGIDVVAPYGEPILAVEDGIVSEVKTTPEGYGRHIRMLCNGNEWVYGHLSEIKVKPLQEVKQGEVIGLMGNSGFVVSGSTPFWKFNPYAGTHLHFGVRKYKKGQTLLDYTVLNYSNGYKGSVDFKDMLPPPPAKVKPKAFFSFNLSIGAVKSNDVKLLQECLQYAGDFPESETCTGNFGPVTLKAVKNYQKRSGISPVSGFVGPLTRSQLNIDFK